jgi:hypothetical protein
MVQDVKDGAAVRDVAKVMAACLKDNHPFFSSR